MSAITSSMSPDYLRVNPYFDRDVDREKGKENVSEPEISEKTTKAEPEKSEKKQKTPDANAKNAKTPEDVQKDVETRAQIAELKRIEAEVIAHEGAHMAVGGQFAGGVSYSKTQGPDGKSYITGGEVPISVPASDDPEETIRNMTQVMAAALAPAKPSSQDLSVAASASSQLAAARAEAASKPDESEETKESQPNLKEKEAMKSYSHSMSESSDTKQPRKLSLAA